MLTRDDVCIFGGCVAEIVFFLYKTGEAMLDASVRPFLVDMVCRDLTRDMILVSRDTDHRTEAFRNGTPDDVCHHLEMYPALEGPVQERSASFLMLYRILINIPAAVLGLMFGAWSDHGGRKLPMMLPSLGSVLAVLLYLTSLVVPRHGLALVMAGAIAQGIMGKSSVITMAVNSYIVDTTPREDRTRKLGKLLAMNFFGLFFGSLLSGTLQDLANLRATLVVVAIFHGVSVLVVGVFVQESVPAESNHAHLLMPTPPLPAPQSFSDANLRRHYDRYHDNDKDNKVKAKHQQQHGLLSLQGVKDSLYVLVKPRPHGGRLIVGVSFLAMVVHQTCKVGEQDITVLFVQRPPLSWPASGYGYLLSVDYAVMGSCLLLLLPLMSRGLGMGDVSIVVVGLCCKLVRTIWAGFCTDTWMVYTSVVVGAMAGVITSSLRSLLSKSVDEDETGKVFALASSGETVAKLVGSVLFINLYAVFLEVAWPGLAYLCAGGVYLILLVLMVWLYRQERASTQIDSTYDFRRRWLSDKALPVIREPDDPDTFVEKLGLLPLCSSSTDLLDSLVKAPPE